MSDDPLKNLYQDVPMRDWGWEIGRPRELLLEVVQGKLVPPGKALDLCSHRGENALYLAQSRFDVTALCPSQQMLEEARKKAEEAGLKVDYRVGNWRNMPFEDQGFDFAYDMGCFGHAAPEERTSFVQRVHGMIKEGGFFLLLVLSYKNGPGEGRFTRAQIESLFHPRFEIIKVDSLDSVHDEGVPFYLSFLMRKLV